MGERSHSVQNDISSRGTVEFAIAASRGIDCPICFPEIAPGAFGSNRSRQERFRCVPKEGGKDAILEPFHIDLDGVDAFQLLLRDEAGKPGWRSDRRPVWQDNPVVHSGPATATRPFCGADPSRIAAGSNDPACGKNGWTVWLRSLSTAALSAPWAWPGSRAPSCRPRARRGSACGATINLRRGRRLPGCASSQGACGSSAQNMPLAKGGQLAPVPPPSVMIARACPSAGTGSGLKEWRWKRRSLAPSSRASGVALGSRAVPDERRLTRILRNCESDRGQQGSSEW